MKMKSKKGQIGMEAIISIGILVFLFLILYVFVLEKGTELRVTEDHLEKRSECLEFSNLISLVFVAGDGATINTSIENVIHVYKDGTIYVEKKIGEEKMALGYYCCHLNECGFLGTELDENFEVTRYITDSCGDNPTVNQFISEIDQYNIVFLEDPHLDYVDATNLDSYVYGGGITVISEHIKQDLFGVNLNDLANLEKGESGPEAEVVNTDSRYSLELGQRLLLNEKPAVKVDDVPEEITFTTIAKYLVEENLAGIAIWSYGLGEVSYFSDFDERTEIDFPAIVVEHIEQIANFLSDPANRAVCTYPLENVTSEGKFSGDIQIQNEEGEITITNI